MCKKINEKYIVWRKKKEFKKMKDGIIRLKYEMYSFYEKHKIIRNILEYKTTVKWCYIW